MLNPLLRRIAPPRPDNRGLKRAARGERVAEAEFLTDSTWRVRVFSISRENENPDRDAASLRGLGQTAGNPILSRMRFSGTSRDRRPSFRTSCMGITIFSVINSVKSSLYFIFV